ncbi:phage tape measure protein [Klebsiella pneumoniae]|nr:phage tape measure protein [Klebsiella pneumoniae]STS27176.1 phage tape measure protein [Klebsiella pneumoniae]STS48484.1 phage tape measure protein [Klebsiella pneumoniae]
MAGTFNAGSVVYEVDMDTSRLLAARREVDAALNGLNGSMGRLEASVNRTERSIGSMERTMSSLSGVAKGLLAALSVQQVASYADAWTELNNKVANSVRTGETQAEVMQRIFDVSQATQSSLNGTATLYARLERGTRTYNTSAEDLTRLTTIINQGFAVSGATAQEAENAIIQLSQGIASGVLRGEEFNSVSEQGSRLMVALADSLGVSIGQLRAMAAQGKLTTDVVVKGLLSQGDAIGKEFANTAVSISKGLQVAGNNVTKFFGENSTVKSFAAGFRDSVITISENLETLGTALIGAAAIMGGRFVGALAMATAAQASRAKQTIQGIAATRQQAKEELATSLQLQRRIQLDKQASLATLKRAEETYALARGTAAEGIAYQNLIRLKSIYIGLAAEEIAANNAVAASQARLAATGITLANTMKVVNAVTAPLGGPIGVIAIVAAGWYLYSQRQAEARKEAIAFADTVPDVIKRLKDMNLAQAQGVRADTVSSIKAQEEGIAKLKEEVADLSNRYKDARVAADNSAKGTWLNNDANEKAAELANELAKKLRDLDGATATLKQTKDALHLINIQVNQGIVDQMRAARDNAIAIAEAEKQASFLGGTQAFLAEKLGQSTQALKAFNSESLKINWGGKEGEMLIKQAERRLALSKLEGEAKARQQAAYDAEDAGITDDRGIKRIQDYYAAIQRNVEGRRAAASEAGKLANQQESVAQKLDRLRAAQDLTTESVEKRRIQEAGLRAEQSLGSGATQKQLEEARALGEANERAAISIQKRKEAEQGQKYAKQEIASTQTTVDPSTGQAVDPLAQINLQEQQKLEALAKYQEIDKQNTQLYEDAKTAILQQASYQRQAILQQEQQTYQQNVSSLLGESSNFAGSLADAIGQAAGKSSAAYQALFAISKGFAIAQASLNLQTAISNAMAIPWPANIPAIAQALSAGTQIVSAISGINYSGARYNGGPVSAGGLYQVGEKGKPEIYQASTGKQYMIPGDNGKVISNKDMNGGQVQVNIQFYDQTSGGQHSFQAQAMQEGNVVTVDAFLNDLDRGGPMTSGIKDRFGLSIKANGAY